MDNIQRTFRQVLAVAKVELLRVLRDKTSFSLIVIVPALQIILFGFAINLDPKNITIAVAGGAPSMQEQLAAVIEETGYFKPFDVFSESGKAKAALDAGAVDVAIELADSADIFDALENDNLITFDDAQAVAVTRVYADGANVSAVAPALRALESAFQQRLLSRLTNKEAQSVPAIRKIWLYNPQAKTAWIILPGLMGVIVMISMLMLGALTLVREKEQGSFETLAVMPISPYLVILGKLMPYIIVALLQALLAVVACTVLFQLPVEGSLFVFFAGILLLAAAHLMLGFTISALANSQLQALQAAVAFYLPSMLLSGFMFPFKGMPTWAQYIGEIFPLTHFVRFSKDMLLRGTSVDAAALHLGPVIIVVLVMTVFAAAAYRRKLLNI